MWVYSRTSIEFDLDIYKHWRSEFWYVCHRLTLGSRCAVIVCSPIDLQLSIAMAQFRYLRTFIDEEPVGVLESRSNSWPQLVGWETKTTREDIETQAASYVAELQGKCIMTFGARPQPPQGTPPPETNPDISGNLAWAQEVAADSIEAQEAQAEVAEYSGNLGNLGSLGHPALCRRPCVRLAKGMCKTGDACDYCHYGHPRYVPPDKRQRCELNDMDTLSLFLCVYVYICFLSPFVFLVWCMLWA